MPAKLDIERKYKYIFSMIMPVYNTEPYIGEAIKSVLNQDLDFKKNVEIILINDGSTDSSEDVCLKYKRKYPDNIKYIKQNNQGVSTARNKGIEVAEGKYVGFLDSDDMISKDSLTKVYTFFEKHHDEIDVCSIKLQLFGSKSGDHNLNFKYKSSRVIDIREKPEFIQTAIGSAFIKTSIFHKGKYSFNEKLQIVEDGELLTKVILEKCAYGVVAGPSYFYRKYASSSSAVGGRWNNISWYTDTPKLAFNYLAKYSQDKFGETLEYVQHFLMFHLKAILTQEDFNSAIPLDVRDKYKKNIAKTLKYISDDVILSQKAIKYDYLLHALSLKHGANEVENLQAKRNRRVYWKKTPLYNAKNIRIVIETIDVSGESVKIKGHFNGHVIRGLRVSILFNGKQIDISTSPRRDIASRSMGDDIYYENGFEARLRIDRRKKYNVIQFQAVCDGEAKFVSKVFYRRTSGLGGFYTTVFKEVNSYIIARIPHGLVLSEATQLNILKKNIRFINEVLKDKINDKKEYIALNSSVKRTLLGDMRKLRNTFRPTIATYWWKYKGVEGVNFGDEITRYIVWALWGLMLRWDKPSEAELAGAGSILEILQQEQRNNRLRIWGSGFIEAGPPAQNSVDLLDVYALRGKHTKSRFKESGRSIPLGDPGLLANLVFKRAKKTTHKVGVVVHYADKDDAIISSLKNNPKYLIINPLQTPDKVAKDITSCEYVLSSSLHGLIFADSFGIPNHWIQLSDKLKGGDYKFNDYYSSTNRKAKQQSLDILNDEDAINNAMRSYIPVKNLRQMQKKLIKSFPYR